MIGAGTLSGQLVTLVALPFLTRLYSVDAFGAYSLALTISALALPFAVMRLDKALLLPRSDGTVKSLLWAGALMALVTASVLGLITWLLGVFGPHPKLALLLALLLLLSSIAALLVPLASRDGRYGSLGLRAAAQSGVGTGVQIAMGVGGATSVGLIAGAASGPLAGIVLLAPYAATLKGRTSPRRMLNAVRRYWRFPIVFMPIAFLALFSQQIPLFLGATSFGLDAAGMIGLAERLVAVPVSLLGLAVGAVFEGEFARDLRTGGGNLVRRYQRTSVTLALIGGVSGVTLALLAPWGVPILFGEEWRQAGYVAQAMSIVVATRLVLSATRNMTQLIQQGANSLVLEITRVVLVLSSAGVSAILGLDLVASLWVIYTALALADAIAWSWGLRLLRRHEAVRTVEN
ncbi:oligosaccharide flippase family protein [Microbacterium esteraromaticum]|nr:oligosaccharide flippase family protein [Microbacterium esteraromaticum]